MGRRRCGVWFLPYATPLLNEIRRKSTFCRPCALQNCPIGRPLSQSFLCLPTISPIEICKTHKTSQSIQSELQCFKISTLAKSRCKLNGFSHSQVSYSGELMLHVEQSPWQGSHVSQFLTGWRNNGFGLFLSLEYSTIQLRSVVSGQMPESLHMNWWHESLCRFERHRSGLFAHGDECPFHNSVDDHITWIPMSQHNHYGYGHLDEFGHLLPLSYVWVW